MIDELQLARKSCCLAFAAVARPMRHCVRHRPHERLPVEFQAVLLATRLRMVMLVGLS